MRMNTQRILAALLSLVLLLALAPAGWAEQGGEAGAANEPVLEGSGDGGAVSLPAAGVVLVDGAYGVNVNLVPGDKEGTAYETEIVKAQVQADLYLIASAKADPMYDTYTYSYEGSSFAGLQESIKTALVADPDNQNDWNTMLKKFSPIAQAAAKLVQEQSITPSIDPVAAGGATEISLSGLNAGMYLLILRGANLKNDGSATSSFTTTTKKGSNAYNEFAENTDGSKDATITVTRAISDNYEFLFEPQLITVPTKVDNTTTPATQNYNTAYGEWENILTITAKPEMKPRYGKVKIIKTLDNYIDLSENQIKEPALFVFEITAVKPSETEGEEGTVVFKDVRGIEFTATGQESIVVDHIPAGSVVTVKEVSSGASYTAVSPLTVSGIEITAEQDLDKIAKAEFENYFNGRNGGHGIINEIEYDGQKWHSDQEGEGWHE